FIGLAYQGVKYLNGQLLNETLSTYQVFNAGGTQEVSTPTVGNAPYRVWLQQSYDASWDLDGSAIPALTTTYQYDGFGNPTHIVAATPDGSKTTQNVYSTEGSLMANWHIDRLISSTVTSTLP